MKGVWTNTTRIHCSVCGAQARLSWPAQQLIQCVCGSDVFWARPLIETWWQETLTSQDRLFLDALEIGSG